MVSVDVKQHVYTYLLRYGLVLSWHGLHQGRTLERVLRPLLYKGSKVDTDTAELRSCVKVKVDVQGSRP